ncbi:hypothetical protein PO472_20920 [Atlantibacter hermannii]|uniref:hypothetical protein n=1 Tax=Atlantibacter hermannii TaxID=565 RepID=UPI002FF7E85B
MTINERVSDERLIKPEIRDSKYWNGLEFKCDLYHLDMQDFYTYANMLTGADYRELQQYRAAAEPVAWMVIDSDSGEKILRVDRSNIEGAAIPLYAAPQVTSVPDEIESTSGSDYDDYYCDGWNACHAAMLNGGKS